MDTACRTRLGGVNIVVVITSFHLMIATNGRDEVIVIRATIVSGSIISKARTGDCPQMWHHGQKWQGVPARGNRQIRRHPKNPHGNLSSLLPARRLNRPCRILPNLRPDPPTLVGLRPALPLPAVLFLLKGLAHQIETAGIPSSKHATCLPTMNVGS